MGGLTRLSEIVVNITEYASLRNIRVVSKEGESREYDLFKAERYGDVSQDPYVKPGDTVTVQKAARRVEITGEVRRPGTYGLLANDTLMTVLNEYADGSTKLADLTRVKVTRKTGLETDAAAIEKVMTVDLTRGVSSFALNDLDMVNVPNKAELLPVVYVEGAVVPEGKALYVLREGDTLYALLRSLVDKIDPGADLKNGTIKREGEPEPISVDMQRLLYSYKPQMDVKLQANDRIVIPYGSDYPVVSVENLEGIGDRALLAMSIPEYPVTPGDTYVLSFVVAREVMTVTYFVDGNYRLEMGAFGTLFAKGNTFTELKDRFEQIVAQFHPGSYPKLILNKTGSFSVYLKGAVQRADEIEAWGLTRLSDVIAENATEYASMRNIRVVSADGATEEYDLFMAERFGDETQDPYVRPGDTIEVQAAQRRVEIEGEVRRPGVYGLLPNDTLRMVLDEYADGATKVADLSRVKVIRRTGLETEAAMVERVITVDLTSESSPFKLNDLDTISVPGRSDLLPVVYLEGAVVPQGKARAVLREGDTLYSVLRALSDQIDPGADLTQGLINREGMPEGIHVDMERLLYSYKPELDYQLKANDRIVVPYGNFEIFLTGEVTESTWVAADSLTRLSSLIEARITDYSSIRDIAVISAGGDRKVYDIFRARRLGEKEQDPYLRPGDTIEVQRVERTVSILGEIERPGTYQLLPGEALVELFDFYGGGLTKLSDPTLVQIRRYDTEGEAVAEVLYHDYTANGGLEIPLKDLDRISVPSKLRLRPFVIFEGAIRLSEEEIGEISTSSQYKYTFEEGERLSSAVEKLAGFFSPVSDLENAYVARNDSSIVSINIEKLLYRQTDAEDLELKPYDVVVIPFRQYFVIVSGAVFNPGRIPYIPNRTWEYYVNVAGGFDPDRHFGERVNITDENNKPVRPDSVIQPEYRIVAPNNNPLYVFNKIAGIVSAVTSVVAIIISLVSP